MIDDDRQVRRRYGNGRIWAGLFLLLVGGVLLLDQMGFPLPDWLFSWHVLLIAIGIFIGLRHNFRGGAWVILIAVGGVYLIQDYNPDYNLHRFIWPGILILVGLIFVLRPRHRWEADDEWKYKWKQDLKNKWRQEKWRRHEAKHEWRQHHWSRFAPDPNNPNNPGNPNNPNNPGNSGNPADPNNPGDPNNTSGSNQFFGSNGPTWNSEDFIDTTSVFGGVHKKIVSKNFKGGDVTTFLGGTELDFTQADINGVVRLDVTQIMGGTKIIVPPHWEVRSQVTAVFAGFEDKRQQPAGLNPDKILIIEGTSIFGGIELKNY